jgi:hypothetical protein
MRAVTLCICGSLAGAACAQTPVAPTPPPVVSLERAAQPAAPAALGFHLETVHLAASSHRTTIAIDRAGEPWLAHSDGAGDDALLQWARGSWRFQALPPSDSVVLMPSVGSAGGLVQAV